MCTLPSPYFLCFGVYRFCVLFLLTPCHSTYHDHDDDKLLLSFTINCLETLVFHEFHWFLQNVYTHNNCTVFHNTFFIGNCEHWWVQKGKDDLADISVIFFIYDPNIPMLCTNENLPEVRHVDQGSGALTGAQGSVLRKVKLGAGFSSCVDRPNIRPDTLYFASVIAPY